MVIRSFLSALVLLLSCAILNAQNYQALHGSPYAGSPDTAVNPASIVHVPFAWDISPLAFQVKQSTNAFRVNNFSLL